MILLQVGSVLFALTMFYWSYLSYRRRTIRLFELLFWWCAWGAFSVLVLFPSSASFFLQKLQINRTMDLVTIVGFMLIWVVVFADHLETRRLRKKIQDLVREIALRDAERP